jgi:hypothetical protein
MEWEEAMITAHKFMKEVYLPGLAHSQLGEKRGYY